MLCDHRHTEPEIEAIVVPVRLDRVWRYARNPADVGHGAGFPFQRLDRCGYAFGI